MIRWRDVGFVAAGAAAAVVLVTRVQAEPIVVSAPPGATPVRNGALAVPSPAPSGPAMMAALGGGEAPLVLARLHDNAMVAVKDHGDSQTVFVFAFDDNGTMKATPQKMRFYYK